MTDETCHLTTQLSRFASERRGPRVSGISFVGVSRPKLQHNGQVARDRALGLRVAVQPSVAVPGHTPKDAPMARSVSINRPRKRPTSRRQSYIEQRPVLQLPLEAPVWREPPSNREERSRDSERGVAVVDFFI